MAKNIIFFKQYYIYKGLGLLFKSVFKQNKFNINGKASEYLDIIRWVSAVLVMIGHIRAIFFVTYSQLQHPSKIITIFYAITGLGHQAVIVFFVLSGLFISASILKSIKSNKWSWKKYLFNRLSRLYIVLVPALLLGLILDKVGIWAFSSTGVYSGIVEDKAIIPFSTIQNSSIQNFVGNLFFLQGILVSNFGSNGPLWSLSYEFWYYMIFPTLILSIFSKSNIKKGAYTIITIILLLFVGKNIARYFIIWILGYVIHLLPKISVKSVMIRKILFFNALLLIVISLFASEFISIKINFDLLIAIVFSLFVYLILSIYSNNNGRISFSKKSSIMYLAGFSYTLYLVHFPLLVFIHAWYYHVGGTKWQPDLIHVLMSLLLSVLLLLYAWVIAYFTEFKTKETRIWLKNVFNRIPYKNVRYKKINKGI